MKQDECDHPEFACRAAAARITGEDGRLLRFGVDVTIHCTACNLPFQFIGPPTGYSFRHPTVDVTGTTLSVPMAPGERAAEDVPSRITYE